MKKIVMLFFFALFILQSIVAQEAKTDSISPWKVSGVISVTANQISLTNWAAGGNELISANGLLNMVAAYNKGKHSWNNNLILAYGTQRIVDQSSKFNKTDDKFEFSSKYGYVLKNKWYYTGIFELKTQMDKGYKKEEDGSLTFNSKAFAPGYLLYTIGIDYKPSESFAIYTSPLTGKTTIVMDDNFSAAGAYGVTPGKNARGEFGAYVKIEFRKEVITNVSLQTKVDFFANYEDKFQEIDVNWDVLIAMKINKFMSANLNTQLLYDQDVAIDNTYSKVQFKEVFGVGLTFKF